MERAEPIADHDDETVLIQAGAPTSAGHVGPTVTVAGQFRIRTEFPHSWTGQTLH